MNRQYHVADRFGSVLHGSDADDNFYGIGNGNDLFWGWGGNDYMSGSGGADIFSKSSGTGVAYGGPGHDQMSFYWATSSIGADMSLGLANGSNLHFRFSDMEVLHGSNHGGGDWLAGSHRGDQIFGWAGNDHIDGRGGNDHLYGGNGGDYLEGGQGTNRLEGGAGADSFYVDRFESTTISDFDEMEGDTLLFASGLYLSEAALDTDNSARWGIGDRNVTATGDGFRWHSPNYEHDGLSLEFEGITSVSVDDLIFG